MDYSDAPQVLRDFLIYHETICGHSKATVDQYYLDLRMFLRFLKLDRGLAPRTAELDEISIADVDLSFLRAVTLTEVYSFLAYLSRDRVRQPNAHEPEYGLSASSRSGTRPCAVAAACSTCPPIVRAARSFPRAAGAMSSRSPTGCMRAWARWPGARTPRCSC